MAPEITRIIKEFKRMNKWGVSGLNAEIALKAKCTLNHVGQVFRGDKPPSRKFINAICAVYGFSKDWIIYGNKNEDVKSTQITERSLSAVDFEISLRTLLDNFENELNEYELLGVIDIIKAEIITNNCRGRELLYGSRCKTKAE